MYLRPNIYVSIFLRTKKMLESDVEYLVLTLRMNKTETEYLPHMWNYWQHGWAPTAVTGKVLFSYLWKNCDTVRAVTVWLSEREVKLIDTMAVVVVLVRPVCVWTVNLSGASQGGAPGLALTPLSNQTLYSLFFRPSPSVSLSLSLWFSTISNVAGSNSLPHSSNLPNETRSDPIKCQRLRRVRRRQAVQSCLRAVCPSDSSRDGTVQ